MMITIEYFPIQGVVVRSAAALPVIENPLYAGEFFSVNQDEYLASAAGQGVYYVRNGNQVEYLAEPGADPAWVRLFLNNQVLVALLHQRKILNLHASGFVDEGTGVLVLGDTGAGKSSLTLSFALGGAGFLTDDLTPLTFVDGRPHIVPLHREIKLRKDTVTELGLEENGLREAEKGTGKKYLKMAPAVQGSHTLDCILYVETGDVQVPMFAEPSPAEKFAILRGEICLSEILAGMPATEALYITQLAGIVEQVPLLKITRPHRIRIAGLHRAVKTELDRIRRRK